MAKGPPDASPASETAARKASRHDWKTESLEAGRRSPRPQPRNREASEGALPDADKFLSKLRGDVKTKREQKARKTAFAAPLPTYRHRETLRSQPQ
jgi:hypothetical protein